MICIAGLMDAGRVLAGDLPVEIGIGDGVERAGIVVCPCPDLGSLLRQEGGDIGTDTTPSVGQAVPLGFLDRVPAGGTLAHHLIDARLFLGDLRGKQGEVFAFFLLAPDSGLAFAGCILEGAVIGAAGEFQR